MSPVQRHLRRAVLIHWKPEEGEARLPLLRDAGWEPECIAPNGYKGLFGVRENPPQAILIDLSRLPSQGQGVATALRNYKSTRQIPLVFVGGAADKIEKLRSVIPDAIYAEWPEIGEALANALRNAPDQPVVPPAMEGYSGTPLWKKLGIKSGTSVSLIRAPQGFTAKLQLPDGVEVRERASPSDRVLLFIRSSKELRASFATAAKSVNGRSGLWIIWPKKASGIETDVSETSLREFGIAHGWVDYKICAVDATWSGLQFARRKE